MGNIEVTSTTNQVGRAKFHINLCNPILTELKLLEKWSLCEIRAICDYHNKLKYPTKITKEHFKVLFKFQNPITNVIFSALDRKRTGKLLFYEVICAMLAFGYCAYSDKIRFFFNLFDLDGNLSIEFDEMYGLILSFVYGIGKFTKTKMPTSNELNDLANHLFAAADYNPDNMLTLKELGNWVELNPDLRVFLQLYEPEVFIPQKITIFLPIVRKIQIKDILATALNKPINDFDLFSPGSGSKSPKHQPTGEEEESASSILAKALQLELKKIKLSPEEEKVKKKPKRKGEGNVITINGSCYSKKDIILFKEYFDKINESKTGLMTMEEYVKAAAKVPYLKRISVSLFHFLDKNATGEVSFRQLLERIAIGAKKRDINLMMKWVKAKELVNTKAQMNYKEDGISAPNNMFKTAVSLRQCKDLLHLFVMYDRENRGKLTQDDLQAGFGTLFPPREIEELFVKHDKDQDAFLSIPEYLELMFSDDYYIPEDLIRSSTTYVEKLRLLKPQPGQKYIQT
jgi:neuronal calcium sensor 1